ncbi:hypothetical protein GJAV_G00120980 [Gymnothorax javanicus]|nr:hypothetical protein GJAV_G00120980 [Gymnothorax javanicus]
MAALMSLSQLSGGSAVYESYYKQVDRANSGRVGPTEGALFLKKSGLSGSTLGKIWELADPNGKGYLDKQGFFVAMRLVACAQNGRDVSIASLALPVPPPKFSDTGSPLTSSTASTSDSQWAVRVEERGKFEQIFQSLSPVNGLLSGDKVKPVLMNSKLPLDVLGKVWELSDVDKDGHLDKDEFAVAMHLVYRAMEKEPVPSSLPPSLIPPSKRRKGGVTLLGSVPVLPAVPVPKRDSLRSSPSLSTPTRSLSPKPSTPPAQAAVSWVVPLADRGRYDELFLKLDSDLDGLVGGTEVKEVFLQSGLPQSLLAHIWTLADTRQKGRLTREQFSLAMHLVQQKVKNGVDPPQSLSPDMLPPSERSASLPDGFSSVEFTGVKELDDISQEIAELRREKFTLEQEIREKKESVRLKGADVQDMQRDLERESGGLQELQSQTQDAQERLEEMDQQKSKLEAMLADVQLKCQEETQKISSVQLQIQAQEADLQSQEVELSRAKADLSRLQQEESQLEQSIQAGQSQLETISRSLKITQDEISQARSRLAQIRDSQEEVTRSIEQCNSALRSGNFADLPLMIGENEGGALLADPFHSEDPFQSDPFKDPFGDNPFPSSSSDNFFKKTGKSDPFSGSAPFSKNSSSPKPKGSEAFDSGDPFGSSSGNIGNKGGFADFSQMSKRFPDDPFGRKQDMQSSGPKKVLPSRPAPPYVRK